MTIHVKPPVIFIGGIVVGVLIVAMLAFNVNRDKKETDKPDQLMPYKWQPVPLPDQLSFAGEAVPLDRWDVREDLDRQLLLNYYWQNNILYILKRSNRYFPLIEQRLKANGVPDDFKYLCVAESSLQNATSKAGAVGFWQFMPATGPGYNLEINTDVDHRYDVIRSTDAACTYLKTAYARFGSWTAAAASYNCGMGGYGTQATFQKTSNYYDLALPTETSQYIYRILTFKYLMENSTQMGYLLESKDRYPPVLTRSVTVTTSVSNLADFALKNGTTYKMLKMLNPWLRSRSLSVKPGRSYTIQLPNE